MSGSDPPNVDLEAAHLHCLAVAARLSAPLAEAFARVGPLAIEPPPATRVAERLCVEVVNQQISVQAAAAIRARIASAATARGLAAWDLFVPEHADTLRACGVSGGKVRALQAIRAAEDQGWLAAASDPQPHAARAAILCRITGVGPWTADMIGIFHFGDPDIWPVGDAAAVGGLRRLTGCQDTASVAAAFAPYRSHLARYLWRIKDSPAIKDTPPTKDSPPTKDLPRVPPAGREVPTGAGTS